MTNFAVCRIQKIKSWASLINSAMHVARAHEIENADLSVKNVSLIEGADGKDIKEMFLEKIGTQKIRSNAVLAIEMLLTASPQYFRPDNPDQAGFYIQERVDNFAAACTDWLLTRYYGKVVQATMHLDESTPHIHAYIVPLDNRGKLNAKGLFHGRHKLSELLDSFARAVEHLGIERGVKGSKAKHLDIKKYYAAVNCKSLHINLDDVLPIPNDNQSAFAYRELIKEILQPQLDILNHQINDRDLQLREKKHIEQTAQASERERQKLESRVQNLAWTLELWQAQANLLRDIPLEEVAYHLGLHLNSKGIWEGNGSSLRIVGAKFYDYSGAQYGSGGAIDLAMHLLQCNFRQAVAWLHEIFGESDCLRAVTHRARTKAQEIIITEKPKQFVAPVKDDSRWGDVRSYLVGARKLPAALIDNLHTAGLIYSDEKQNAIFLMRSLPDEEVTGAFLRGTYGYNNTFYGLAKGSKRNKGWFHFTTGGQSEGKIARAVLVKSPIEALSVAVLSNSLLEKTIYIAVDSVQCVPIEFLGYFKEVVAAYDADGEEIAGAVLKLLPQTTRLKPKARDWNQQLILIR